MVGGGNGIASDCHGAAAQDMDLAGDGRGVVGSGSAVWTPAWLLISLVPWAHYLTALGVSFFGELGS